MLLRYHRAFNRVYLHSQSRLHSSSVFLSARNGLFANKEQLFKNIICTCHTTGIIQSRLMGSSFPNITDFTNCREYLLKAIENRKFEINSDEWEYLLDQIVETLPANSHGNNFVKHYHCHTFALGVCAEAGNASAAIALLEYMKRGDEKITDIHRKFVCKAFQQQFKTSKEASSNKGTSSSSASERLIESSLVDKLLSICDEILQNESFSIDYSHIDVLTDVATALAYTSKWLEGYKIWEKLRHNKSTKDDICTDSEVNHGKILKFQVDESTAESTPVFGRIHNIAFALARTALENNREDIFWTILNDASFHNNHVYIRYGVSNEMLKKNEEIYEEYLRYSIEKYRDSSTEALDALSKLFEYLRKHFVLISLKFYWVLHNILSENAQIFDTKSSTNKNNKKCVQMKQNKFGDTLRCKNCRESIGSPHLSQRDIDLLKDNIMNRLIVSDDIYQNSDPQELKKFDAVLTQKETFDIVIDGLNVCGLASQGVKKGDTWKERRMNPRLYYQTQEFILLSVLKKLQEQELKPLLIHRKVLEKFKNFKEIKKLCQYVILDNTSNDDPFFIAAALNSGPKTYILTNDILRQHNTNLEDVYLRRIFSYWQMLSQVKVKWLSFITERPDDKGIFKAEDGSFRKVQLYFPDNRVIRASRNSNGWHIPITPAIPEQKPGRSVPVTMIRPTNWACISN